MQLSASSFTNVISDKGRSPMHSTFKVNGLEAVGAVMSFTVIVCVTRISFAQISVTEYVLVMISGHVAPFETSETN